MSEPTKTGPGLGQGGGDKFEPVEGSLTDGGSLPGSRGEDRSFGAGRQAESQSQPGHTGPQGEGGGAMSGRGQEDAEGPAGAGDAGPSGEQSGYGNTPPRE